MKFQVHTTSRSEIFKFKFAAGKNDLPGLNRVKNVLYMYAHFGQVSTQSSNVFFLEFYNFPSRLCDENTYSVGGNVIP